MSGESNKKIRGNSCALGEWDANLLKYAVERKAAGKSWEANEKLPKWVDRGKKVR